VSFKNIFKPQNRFRSLTMMIVMAALAYVTVDIIKSENIDKNSDFDYHDIVWDHYDRYDDYEDDYTTITIFTESGNEYEIGNTFVKCIKMPMLFRFSKGEKLTVGTLEQSGFFLGFERKMLSIPLFKMEKNIWTLKVFRQKTEVSNGLLD